MESAFYQVLARKYRPQQFKDLIGQELLLKTLVRALADRKCPHALLFHGTRGVGKTTLARLLAKALNCFTPQAIEPCGTCRACTAISEGRFLDVLEMDAASHTSVENIRDVIETARYKAVMGQAKVYIIDEAHMLSKSAFNALLKTLEEPPPNVYFILATTELRRMPETILSRCMRFDLKRVGVTDLVAHLKHIALQEGVTLEDSAAMLLAQNAEGSVRDSLSLFDQAIALAGKVIKAEAIHNMLGLVARIEVLGILQHILAGNPANTLLAIQDLHFNGADSLLLATALLDTIYGLTCLKVDPRVGAKLCWSEAEHAKAQEILADTALATLVQHWQVLSQGIEEIGLAAYPNQALEMVLVRMVYLSPLPSAHDLLKALAQTPALPEGNSPAPAAPSITPSTPIIAKPHHPLVQDFLQAFPGARVAN